MSLKRFTSEIDSGLNRIAIDLGYSNRSKSCGLANEDSGVVLSLEFGECVRVAAEMLRESDGGLLILEAVLSTYHGDRGNPEIRGEFERGRGWYHGPGVTTFAAALRFLRELDHILPQSGRSISLVEGFLSYKPVRTTHADDAQRMLAEFESAERFRANAGSEPICDLVDGVPEILRYNPPIANRSH